MNNEQFLCYTAGFFDGEGSAWSSIYKNRLGNPSPKLTVKVAQVDRRPLEVIVEFFGCGRIYTKYDKRMQVNGWQECHEIHFAHKAARYFLTQIEPFLIVKKENISALLDKHGREYVYTKK